MLTQWDCFKDIKSGIFLLCFCHLFLVSFSQLTSVTPAVTSLPFTSLRYLLSHESGEQKGGTVCGSLVSISLSKRRLLMCSVPLSFLKPHVYGSFCFDPISIIDTIQIKKELHENISRIVMLCRMSSGLLAAPYRSLWLLPWLIEDQIFLCG